jgi:hypothetical protein
MRRVVAALIVCAVLIQANWIADAQGQASCTFKLGFATLRDLVGSQKIGTCLEDEHFNEANGNAEQRTSGGLLVWRKIDNFTAFTDGGTTWVNGPNGLQSRPNSERFAWERDPLSAPSAGTSASTSPSSPSSTTSSPPRSAGSPVASIGNSSSAGSSSDSLLADASPTSASTPTKAPTNTPSATATPAATATSAATPTKTPNPVSLKFTDKPDEADTGQDVHVEVETNAKKGSCTLTITYNNSDPGVIGTDTVDDDKCEWTFNLPENTKTGRAKILVSVTGENGTASTDDSFDVNKGDSTLSGDVNVELELKDFPEDAKVGESVKFTVQSNVKKKGTCNLSVAWPKVAATGGEQKTPDGDGRCSWTMVVPTVPKKGTATATITVTDKDGRARSINKEFDVKPS